MKTTPSPASLDIHVHRLSATALSVAVAGEIDMSTTGPLLDVLLEALPVSRPGRIEVDLDGVTFLDCGGLTALLTARETAARADCHLLIVGPRPAVRRLLILTGLLDILTAGPAPATAVFPGDRDRGRTHLRPAHCLRPAGAG